MAVDDKNKVIAVARLQYNSDTEAQIRYMAVAREYERQGIGHELVKTLEQHAQNSSCKKNRSGCKRASYWFLPKAWIQGY